MISSSVEGPPPRVHHRGKAFDTYRQQPFAIGWVALDQLGEMLGMTDRLHAASFDRFDELRVVVLNEALGRKGTAGNPPQQETAHIRGMAQRRQQGQTAA